MLRSWPEAHIINPYGDSAADYLRVLEAALKNAPQVDILAVSAGFDAYLHDLGQKLASEDYFTIGRLLQAYAIRLGHRRRFAALEGGYYLPDLGKNVLAFCRGSFMSPYSKPPVLTITPPRDRFSGYDRIDIDLADVRGGNVRCRFMMKKVVVYSIQVFPEFQGNGYGAATIDMLKSRFSVIVADRVRFNAREFWQRMGFKELPDGNWEFRRPA